MAEVSFLSFTLHSKWAFPKNLGYFFVLPSEVLVTNTIFTFVQLVGFQSKRGDPTLQHCAWKLIRLPCSFICLASALDLFLKFMKCSNSSVKRRLQIVVQVHVVGKRINERIQTLSVA